MRISDWRSDVCSSDVDIMLLRDIAHGALEEKYFVGEAQRIAVNEVHLQLRGDHFVDHRIDSEPHQLAIVIDMIDDILSFVHSLEPIALAGYHSEPRNT